MGVCHPKDFQLGAPGDANAKMEVHPQPSSLDPQPSTLNPRPSTLDPEP